MIPASKFSKPGTALRSFYAAPNLPGLPDGENNFINVKPGQSNYHSASGRLDFNISDKQKLYFNFRQAENCVRDARPVLIRLRYSLTVRWLSRMLQAICREYSRLRLTGSRRAHR